MCVNITHFLGVLLTNIWPYLRTINVLKRVHKKYRKTFIQTKRSSTFRTRVNVQTLK